MGRFPPLLTKKSVLVEFLTEQTKNPINDFQVVSISSIKSTFKQANG